jgi:hypothetical protein
MKKKYLVFATTLIFIGLAFTSCLTKPDFPNTPTISFKSLKVLPIQNPTAQKAGDSLTFTISFTDGDGDLGQSNNDTTINFFVSTFKKQGENFIPVVYDGGQNFNSKFPILDIVGGSPLEGDLRYGVQFPYLAFAPITPLRRGDIVRFSIQIMDRAGNKSNVVQTNEVVLGKYE